MIVHYYENRIFVLLRKFYNKFPWYLINCCLVTFLPNFFEVNAGFKKTKIIQGTNLRLS